MKLIKLLIFMSVTVIITNLCGCTSNKESSITISSSSKENIIIQDDNKNKEETKKDSEKKEETVIKNDKINNEITDEIRSLSNEASGWGPGTDFDKDNRPQGAVAFQDKYGKYNADFIAKNTKKIYLTFDEGYENGYTSKILDILKEKNVKAVFFVTEPYAKTQGDLIKRMVAEGHVVGSHSVTHPDKGMPSLSLEQQRNEMQELHKYIKDNFNYDMYLFRYPCGIFSEQSLALMQNLGYRSVFWSFAYADWDPNNQPNETEALNKITSRLHNGAIYLLHAVSKTNTNILGQFIDNARSKGFEFDKYTI